MRMGGSVRRVCIRLMPGPQVEKLRNERLMLVDATKAGCYLINDHDRLLGIIEAAFGDCSTFNTQLREFFRAALSAEHGTTSGAEPEEGVQLVTGMGQPKSILTRAGRSQHA